MSEDELEICRIDFVTTILYQSVMGACEINKETTLYKACRKKSIGIAEKMFGLKTTSKIITSKIKLIDL